MAKAVPTENFTRELKRFERAIDVIDREQPDLTDKQVIEVLISRDALQHLLENDIEETCEEIAQLHVLDEQLQTLGSTIAANADMENLRITLSRPDAYWWWAFEPPTDAWDKLDWLWNTLSIVLLALAASFMFSIYSAFSAGDATVATAFSMIIQLVGLAVIGSGAITEQGQEHLKSVLKSLNIPPRFQAEFTVFLALLLLVAAYFTNSYLDQSFFDHGTEMYQDGQLTDAEQAYIQGLAIDPDQLEFHHKLGQVYESLGELQPAFEHYLIGSEAGSPSTLNDLGRVAINHYDPVSQETDVALATAYLLLGLQRAETDLDTPPYTYYQLNKNIGWTLIEQEKYDKAIPYLITAMRWRGQVGEGHTKEGGMGNCFLAYAYEQIGNDSGAVDNWRKCIKYGRPNYVHEYRWLTAVGKDDVAYCVNTEKVVAGFKGVRQQEGQEWCDALVAGEDF